MKQTRGPEAERMHSSRLESGFYAKYMMGKGLDIGYKGDDGTRESIPVLATAIGVDLDYPGYNGMHLPFGPESKDYVFASHTLEHMCAPVATIQEWFRVIKTGGHLIITVPHQLLYERKRSLPSKLNRGHTDFYTPQKVLLYIDYALQPNTYRVRHLRDNDDGYDYSVPLDKHPSGAYEIECVIQKIEPPKWELE